MAMEIAAQRLEIGDAVLLDFSTASSDVPLATRRTGSRAGL
jgi:hypothetical protein